MTRMRLACLAILGCLTIQASAADMYRTIADDGTVIFSDRPLDSSSQLVSVETGTPATAPASEPADTAQAPSVAQLAAATRGSAVASNTSPEELATQTAENCAAAREHLNSLLLSDRLFRVLGDGTREYLSAEDVELSRAQAREQVARWCE